ncbi:phage minor head protein [uncultured Desulfobacter sp.]|uniref:phage head morphogenesis protein n=1 Tax=uncultured Desulfobacter sp. TaxID=240139 RepID=UPI002AAB6B16|nr:phage minor head protein [uncultured Desulfobacter sp.]
MAFEFNPGPPKDAYEFWQDKVPMSRKAFNAMAEDARVKAFVVSGMAKGDMLQAMYDSIGTALEAGQPIGSWKADLRTLFDDKGWKQIEGFRLDNIFRTNIQTAYMAGRYRQMTNAVKTRPFWRYSAINDRRTRLAHAALHGRVVRADDPFWDKFYPPNGFRCRCTVTSLSAREMARNGVKPETIEPGQPLEITMSNHPHKGRVVPVMPDNNFQTNPGKSYWQADTGRFRADVRQAVLKDITRACPDEFCGACEFAETDCFKRLKRHLTPADLEALQTVVWAENKQLEKDFSDWARQVVDTRKEKGEIYPVGNLPGKVLRYLAQKGHDLSLALTVIDDGTLKHLSRPDKADRQATLDIEEIATLPQRFKTARWFYDTKDPAVLLTWDRDAGVWAKVVIRVDFKINKKTKANVVRTGGIVPESDILKGKTNQEGKRYEEI